MPLMFNVCSCNKSLTFFWQSPSVWRTLSLTKSPIAISRASRLIRQTTTSNAKSQTWRVSMSERARGCFHQRCSTASRQTERITECLSGIESRGCLWSERIERWECVCWQESVLSGKLEPWPQGVEQDFQWEISLHLILWNCIIRHANNMYTKSSNIWI